MAPVLLLQALLKNCVCSRRPQASGFCTSESRPSLQERTISLLSQRKYLNAAHTVLEAPLARSQAWKLYYFNLTTSPWRYCIRTDLKTTEKPYQSTVIFSFIFFYYITLKLSTLQLKAQRNLHLTRNLETEGGHLVSAAEHLAAAQTKICLEF